MPGAVRTKVVFRSAPIAASGASQTFKHRLGLAPRFVKVILNDIPSVACTVVIGTSTRVLVDVQVTPAATVYIIEAEK